MLRLLCLEDSPQDVEIMRELLIDAGFDLEMDCTEVEKEFVSLLHRGSYDIILADFKLPGFDAFAALRWTMEICPNVPFICVSGSIGEEAAVELLKQGAVDYVLKGSLVKLPAAIKRALDESKEKDARRRAEAALQESESQFRELWGATVEGITILDKGIIIEVNDAMCQMFGYIREHVIGKSLLEFAPAEMHDLIRERIASGREGRFETSALRADGARIILEAFAKHFIYQGKSMRLVTTRDITERKRTEEVLHEATKEREKLIQELQSALDNVKTLQGLIPICANCKKIRDDKGFWNQVEGYIMAHSDATFTHGVCPDCSKKLYGDLYEKALEKQNKKNMLNQVSPKQDHQ